MAAGVATVVGKPTVGPSGISSENQSHGFISLSTSYQAGGDSLDISALGLATLDFLILGLPSKADGSASAAVFFPLVRSEGLLPLRTTQFGGGSLIKIQAFTTTSAEETGDLSSFIIPYIAFGT